MTELNLGNRIRLLRKKKGVTQETVAAALMVSPQAVSKWESGTSYPEMTLVPLIARYFGVSLDYLFDYDMAAANAKIEKLIKDNRELFFDAPRKYQALIQSVLMEYPDNEALLQTLLSSYEYELRNFDRTDHLEEIIDISGRLMAESRDPAIICDAMDVQAAAYLRMGMEEKAIAILESMPKETELRYDSMAFRLTREKKLSASIKAQWVHLQMLYMGCFEEGNALFALERYGDAAGAYDRGRNILTMYLRRGESGQKAYLWNGMQTFHWSFFLLRSACDLKQGKTAECEEYLEAAWQIVSTGWEDFEMRKDYYVEPFVETMENYGLRDYIPAIRDRAK